MLKIENLVAKYGSIEALHAISLQVGEREMVALRPCMPSVSR